MKDPLETPPFGTPATPDPRASRQASVAAYAEAAVSGAGANDTVATGFASVDQLLGGGIRRADLVVLGGDVSAGKSALALAIALRASKSGRAVAYLSGEMTGERIVERALALEGRVTMDALRHGALDDEGHARIAAVALELRDRAPVLATLPERGVAGIADLLIEHLGLELVVVDPLQSLAAGAAPLDEELARAVRELKQLALRRSAAVLAVCHIQRAVRERADARPTLEDFGSLGSVKQHADVVLGLYREELYTSDSDVEGAAELHVLKNRGGANGYADLYFYRKWLRFEDVNE
jgi:replicative DNA helicase